MDIQDVRIFPADHLLHCDICIVGSGPAGITIAKELANGPLSILIVESGGRSVNPWSENLNAFQSTGVRRNMDHTKLRNRVLGGSSHTWTGRIAALDENDFLKRPWVPFSGWPFPRNEYANYLPRTLPYLGAIIADNNDPILRQMVLRNGANNFNPELLQDYIWSLSRVTTRGKLFSQQPFMRFGPWAAQQKLINTQCLINATVVHIITNDYGTVAEGVEVKGPDGHTRKIHAKTTVLCGGGIENARMMLASSRVINSGIGNANDQVGRYLMDHPRGNVGNLKPNDFISAQRIFGSRRRLPGGRPTVVIQGAALSKKIQKEKSLLNCAVYYDSSAAEYDPYSIISRSLSKKKLSTSEIVALGREVLFIGSGIGRLAISGRTPIRRLENLPLLAMVEQAPNPQSRVLLGDTVDALGVPISRIHWSVSEQEKQSVLELTRSFITECARLKYPIPELSNELSAQDPFLDFTDIAHPTGTTRMSTNPKAGVVDANCAVHGVIGLYVAGTSIFATSGHTNPTQSIVAFAIRLADYLKARH